MMADFESFLVKFRVEKFLIARLGGWVVSLRPLQPTVGSLVLSLGRPCVRISDLSEREGSDLALAFRAIARLYERSFRPDKINYLALMMVDRQVHFHVVPRYAGMVVHEGVKFVDKDWPNPHSLIAMDLSEQMLTSIHRKLMNSMDFQ